MPTSPSAGSAPGESLSERYCGMSPGACTVAYIICSFQRLGLSLPRLRAALTKDTTHFRSRPSYFRKHLEEAIGREAGV